MQNKNTALRQLNRQAIVNGYCHFLNYTRLSPTDVWLGMGAAMVLHGLRHKTSNLDAGAHMATMKPLSARFHMPLINVWKEQGYLISGKVLDFRSEFRLQLFDEPRIQPSDLVVIEGVTCYSLEALLRQKRLLNRDKDQQDIYLLQHALEQRKYQTAR